MSFFPDESILMIKPDEDEHPNWRLYFGGIVYVYDNGVEAFLISTKIDHDPVVVQLKFPCTNNVAE